jgi:hypothetical protein
LQMPSQCAWQEVQQLPTVASPHSPCRLDAGLPPAPLNPAPRPPRLPPPPPRPRPLPLLQQQLHSQPATRSGRDWRTLMWRWLSRRWWTYWTLTRCAQSPAFGGHGHQPGPGHRPAPKPVFSTPPTTHRLATTQPRPVAAVWVEG